MSLRNKTKAELLDIIAAERDVVRRARQAISDLEREREKRHAVEAELRDLKAKPVPERIIKEIVRVDVPVTDPKVMAEIEQLRAQIAAINYDDLKAAKEYRRRIDMARG